MFEAGKPLELADSSDQTHSICGALYG